MSLDHVYVTINNVGVNSKYSKSGTFKKAEMGVCAAMSALWLKNMHKSRPLLTKPESWAAAPVYQRAASKQDAQGWSSEKFNLEVLKNCDLNASKIQKMTPGKVIKEVQGNDGYYYLNIGNHALGFAKRDKVYFFFDPNCGLFQSRQASDIDLEGWIKATYSGAGYWSEWKLFTVS